MPPRAEFTDVDAGDVDALLSMMDATDAWPAVRSARMWVLEQAGIGPGVRVLDVGCGPGTFGAQARSVGAEVVDLDVSMAMLGAVRRRHGTVPVVRADASTLPVAERAVDVVHVERALQWSASPAQALDELVRVVGAGGVIAVTDSDWSTCSVGHDDPAVVAALAAAALAWVPHPTLAGEVAALLAERDVTVTPARRDEVVVAAWDPDDPLQHDGPPGLPLRSIAAGAAAGDRRRAEDAVEAVAVQARRGRFRATLTLVTTLARRPALRPARSPW